MPTGALASMILFDSMRGARALTENRVDRNSASACSSWMTIGVIA